MKRTFEEYDEGIAGGVDFGYDDSEDVDDDVLSHGHYAEPGEYPGEEPEGLFATRGRVITLVGLVVLLALIFTAVAWLLGTRAANGGSQTADGSSGLQTAVKVGALAPDFELSDAFTGKPVRLSSFRGRPVWVNFWASWCNPCKAEMPDMKKRYDRDRTKGLVILGVDLREDVATVKQFTTLNGYDWTFLLDSDGSVNSRYFVAGIPTHVFVDKNGVIKALVTGGITPDMMDENLAKIVEQ